MTGVKPLGNYFLNKIKSYQDYIQLNGKSLLIPV